MSENNNDKFKGLFKDFNNNDESSFDEKLKNLSPVGNNIQPAAETINENENFVKLSSAITEIPEFELLNQKDRAMFNVILEFWNESIYSKFISLAESNKKDGSGALLREIETIKSAIYLYNLTDFKPYYDLNLGISETSAYREYTDYFTRIKNQEIPFSLSEIKRFKESIQKVFAILENEKNIAASYKNSNVKAAPDKQKKKSKSKSGRTESDDAQKLESTDYKPEASEKKYTLSEKAETIKNDISAENIKLSDAINSKSMQRGKKRKKIKIKAKDSSSLGCFSSVVVFFIVMQNYSAVQGFLIALTVYCVFDMASSFSSSNPEDLKNSFTMFSLAIGTALGTAASGDIGGAIAGLVISAIVSSYISEPIGSEKDNQFLTKPEAKINTDSNNDTQPSDNHDEKK